MARNGFRKNVGAPSTAMIRKFSSESNGLGPRPKKTKIPIVYRAGAIIILLYYISARADLHVKQ